MKKPKATHTSSSLLTLLQRAWRWQPTIDVSQYAIDRSKPRDSHWCMLTRGICYTLTGATRVCANANVIQFTYQGFRYTFNTPADVVTKMVVYDDKGKLAAKPFSFRLAPPVGVRPSIAGNRTPKSKTGKHKGNKVCTTKSSMRWHGLKVPPQLQNQAA